ncbi:MAG: thioesterase family protein [Gammaproteobacteria bacterium]|nr:thioesterase family protein [Gammaproteobacteria bacterium]
MRLRLRLLLLTLFSFWKKPLNVLDESVLNLRVLPNDIDITKITNDRFIALMDLGRMDIAFRVGLLKSMIKNKWVPLATFATIRFRYPLRVFQKYQLRTRILWWDEATFYFEQIFERKGRVVASGSVSATLLGSNGPISSKEILAAIGQPVTKPNEPIFVARLKEIDNLIHESQKD